MTIDTLSQKLSKTLLNGNTLNNPFTSLQTSTTAPPMESYGTLPSTGVWSAGHNGAVSANRVMLLPYCTGPAGSQFSMRIYGWNVIDIPNNPPPTQAVWIFYLLAEFSCTSCNVTGPVWGAPGVSNNNLQDTEHLCDTITLVQGALGLTGYINSTGPGTDLPANAIVELCGCRFFQFDFQQTDPVSMNCFWAKC